MHVSDSNRLFVFFATKTYMYYSKNTYVQGWHMDYSSGSANI